MEYHEFLETRGNQNIVLYYPEMYIVEDGYLRYNHKFTGELELPFCCSTCYRMFAKRRLRKGLVLGEKFDTSSIVDMAQMFQGSTFSQGFSLGSHFFMGAVQDQDGMFSDSLILPTTRLQLFAPTHYKEPNLVKAICEALPSTRRVIRRR